MELLGIAGDPIAAGRDVRATAGIGRHDPHAPQLRLRIRRVQELGEGDDVRGIQADDPGPQRLRRRIARRSGPRHQDPARHRDQDAKLNHAVQHGKTLISRDGPTSTKADQEKRRTFTIRDPQRSDGTSWALERAVATPLLSISTHSRPRPDCLGVSSHPKMVHSPGSESPRSVSVASRNCDSVESRLMADWSRRWLLLSAGILGTLGGLPGAWPARVRRSGSRWMRAISRDV